MPAACCSRPPQGRRSGDAALPPSTPCPQNVTCSWRLLVSTVPTLPPPPCSEMPPEGKVGISPVCILGVNINRGQEISLRLRTDDLRGGAVRTVGARAVGSAEAAKQACMACSATAASCRCQPVLASAVLCEYSCAQLTSSPLSGLAAPAHTLAAVHCSCRVCPCRLPAV